MAEAPPQLETVIAHHEDPPRHRGAVAFLLVLVLLVAGVAGVGAAYFHWCQGAGDTHAPVRFAVPAGASGDDVVSDLKRQGVIRCGGLVGRILLQRTGKATAIRAGTFDLTTNMTLAGAVDALTAPPSAVRTVSVTFPEGYRITQMGERVQQELGLSAKTFDRLALSGRLARPPYLPRGSASAEGFLFPDTYEFEKAKATEDGVIHRLLDQFAVEAKRLPWKRARDLGVTRYQAVIIASMVEKEARIAADRGRIAAVVYNRIKAHMPIGFDSTLLYVDPTPQDGLSQSELAIHSPYNTRLHRGLPPTPIANPGLASLRAALNPAHVPFLYFVTCGADGHAVFSVRYADFVRNKNRCVG